MKPAGLLILGGVKGEPSGPPRRRSPEGSRDERSSSSSGYRNCAEFTV